MKNLLINIFENYNKNYFVLEIDDFRINFIDKEFSARIERARYNTIDKLLLFFDVNLEKKYSRLSADDKNEFHNYMEKKYNIEISLIY